jgi:hypothetical protein
MRVSRTLTLAALVSFIASSTAPAWGQSAPPAAAGAASGPIDDGAIKAKFANALRLHKAGKFDEALPIFRELVQVTQSPNARLYVGLCLEQLGKNAEAYKEMAQTVKDATAHADPKYDQTREAAQAELAVLNVRVGKLVVTLPETPPGLVVNVDGAPIAERDIGASMVLEPGGHRVEATATGQTPVTREVTLEGGETRTVTIAFSKPEPVAAPKPHPAPEPPASRATMRLAAFSAVGVGGAGLAMFAVTGVMAKGKYNSLKSACGDRPCTDPKYSGDIDSGKTLQTVANVGLVIGVAGLVGGGALFYFGSKKDAPRASATPLPGGGYMSYAGSF